MLKCGSAVGFVQGFSRIKKMFNNEDKNGFVRGTEVVEYKGEKWLVVAEGNSGIVLENDFSNDPNYREYSAATMMYANVDYIPEWDMNNVQPFASIIMKSGKDEEWNKVYRSVGLMD
jgi:hypothetical protein